MNKDDWKEFYRRAFNKYKKSKFMSGLERQDFAQTCAEQAVKALDKGYFLESDKSLWMNQIIEMTAKNYYVCDNNIKNNRSREWKRTLHECELEDQNNTILELEDADSNNVQTKFLEIFFQENKLDSKQRYIIEMLQQGYTYEEIGKSMDVSKQRVQQIIKKMGLDT